MGRYRQQVTILPIALVPGITVVRYFAPGSTGRIMIPGAAMASPTKAIIETTGGSLVRTAMGWLWITRGK